MAMKALNLTQTIKFSSPRDPDKENPTLFILGAIPSRVYAILKDKAASFTPDPNSPDGMRAEFNGNLIAYDIVRWGLKGVENYELEYQTQKEKVGSYQYDVVHDDFMKSLELETIREISEAVNKLCEIEATVAKKSEG